MTFTLNSIERVEIEESFMKIFWLDRAVVELKYIISEEKDDNMKRLMELAQAKLHKEMNDGWLNLCRVVKKYTEPPYSEKIESAIATLARLDAHAVTLGDYVKRVMGPIARLSTDCPMDLDEASFYRGMMNKAIGLAQQEIDKWK